jgi:hypothetical protein
VLLLPVMGCHGKVAASLVLKSSSRLTIRDIRRDELALAALPDRACTVDDLTTISLSYHGLDYDRGEWHSAPS